MRRLITSARKDGRKDPRRGSAPLRHLRRALPAVALPLAAGAALWLAYSDIPRTVGEATRSQVAQWARHGGLAVHELTVSGRRNTATPLLREATGLAPGTPILAVDLVELRQRVEALPWVAEARVERRLPDQLALTLVERNAVALYQAQEGLWLVDSDGTAFRPHNLGAYAGLPILRGAGAPAAVGALQALIDTAPRLRPLLRGATRQGERRWDLHLVVKGRPLLVRLPDQDPDQALARLIRLDDEQSLMDRDLAVIDLRFDDRLMVRLTPTARQRLADGDEEA